MPSTSLYTGKSLKAYKSFIEAYINGWVEIISVRGVPKSYQRRLAIRSYIVQSYFVFGRIKHSQRLSEPPAKPWVAFFHNNFYRKKERRYSSSYVGIVLSCKAGLGEACSHAYCRCFFYVRRRLSTSKNTDLHTVAMFLVTTCTIFKRGVLCWEVYPCMLSTLIRCPFIRTIH